MEGNIVMDISDMDRKIMQLRALGYRQDEISRQLNISQSTVSQRLEEIREIAHKEKDLDKFFLVVMLGVLGLAAIALLAKR